MFSHEDLVAIVRNATDKVFRTMLNVVPEHREAYQNAAPTMSRNGIVSLIGFAGIWVGTGSINCGVSLARNLAGKLMVAEYESVTDDVLDALAELTNMIVGNVKTALEEPLGPMGLSIPTVIHGRNFSSRTIGTQEWSVVPFNIDGELFEVQLCLAPNRQNGRPRLAVA